MKVLLCSIVLAILCQLPVSCSAQQLFSNYTDITNSPGKEMYELYQYYFYNKPGSRALARLWDEEEVKRNHAYDILKNWQCGGTYADRCYVLKISKIDSGIYAMKMAMGFLNDTDEMNIVSNITYLVKQERRGLRLSNYLYYSTRNWKKFFTKSITFYTPLDYTVNTEDAQKSERFLSKIFNTLDLDPRPVTYYATPTCEQMQQAIGLDAFVGNIEANTCSCMDTANAIIFSGGKGFYDPQDLAHVISSYFPKAHPMFMTGLTGLLGGYNGDDMGFFQQQFLDYMDQHPDVDLSDLPSLHQLDKDIDPQYLVGAVFCAAALKSGGPDKLKKLLSYGTKDTDFYMAIFKELKVSRNKAKEYFLTQLKDPELFSQYDDL